MKKETLQREYITNGLQQHEIGEKYNISQSQVSRLMIKFNIEVRPKHKNIDESLTIEEEQFIFGKLLGDGSVYQGPTSVNARIGFAHIVKNKDYVDYCYRLIKRWCHKPPRYVKYKRNPKVYKNPEGEKYVLETMSHPEFSRIRRLFYERGRKIVNRDILNNITPLGLAIWYQDDGSLEKCSRSHKPNGARLHTLQFPKESVEMIVQWLEETYDIKANLNRSQKGKDGISQYSIRIGKKQLDKFFNLIKPYVVDSMKYKIVDDIVRSS